MSRGTVLCVHPPISKTQTYSFHNSCAVTSSPSDITRSSAPDIVSESLSWTMKNVASKGKEVITTSEKQILAGRLYIYDRLEAFSSKGGHSGF